METNYPHQQTSSINFGSVGFYVAALVTGVFLFLVGLLSAQASEDFAILAIILAVIAFVIAQIYFFVLLYRLWKFAIHESRRHDLTPSIETPAKAIGFLFIPFFSLYWIFQAFGKLPKDLNAIAEAKESPGPKMSPGIGTALAVLFLLGIIPFVGYITTIVSFIVAPIFISKAIEISRRLNS